MKLLLALSLCALCLPSRAADAGHGGVADEIKSRLSPFEVLRGDFQQSKKIRIIKKPLHSSGNFVLLKGKGVLWNVKKPLPSLLKVTPSEVTQIKDGKAAFSLKAEAQPALRLVGRVLFAVFSADLAELKKHFEISGKVSGKLWEAKLLPKEPWVAKVAKGITLKGGSAVDSLLIHESNGDQTLIQFLNVNLKSPLKSGEQALFE